MTYGYGSRLSGRGERWWATKVPRNRSSAERPFVALGNAGNSRVNPILAGLGVTLLFEGNAAVRTLTATLVYGEQSKDLTGLLELRADGRWEFKCVAGDPDSLGFEGVTYETPVTMTLVLRTRNIRKVSEIQYLIRVSDPAAAKSVLGSPTSNTQDFELHRTLQLSGFKLWEHINSADYDLESSLSVHIWVLDAHPIIFADPPDTLCEDLNFYHDYHSGIWFSRTPTAHGLAPGISSWNGVHRYDSVPPVETC